MSSGKKRLRRSLPYLFVLLQGLIYGVGDPISKKAYEVMPVYSLLSARYVIASAAIFLSAGRRVLAGLKKCSIRDWLLPCLCIAGSYTCGNAALELTEATSVAFIRSLSTIFAPVLALLIFRRRYSWKHIPIQALVVLGLYLLAGGPSGFGAGEVLAGLAAVFMAGSLVFGERSLDRVDPITLSALQTAASAVAALLCAVFLDGGWDFGGATVSVWLVILYLAVCCTVFGYLLQNAALERIPSRTVALLQCFCPVMTALFSFFILRERLSTAGVIGAALILLCVIAETRMPEETPVRSDH